jgi:hypothetical protein
LTPGPQLIQAGEAIRRQQEGRDLWPYPWVMPPVDAEERQPMGAIASPAVGAQAQILQFSVPSGYRFWLGAVLIGAFGNNQVPIGIPGQDFVLTIDKNTPLGAPVIQSSPLADWTAIPFNMGSLYFGPEILRRAREFAPEDIIRAKVLNVSLGVGAPNMFCAKFAGYLVPEENS